MNHMKQMAFGKASDLLITGTLGKYDAHLAYLFEGSVELVVDNVVPGEPIRVRWRVNLGLRGTDSTSFSIRLLIDGQPVHERNGIPAEQATIGAMFVGDHNFQVDTVVIGYPNVARIVYRLGAKKLSAEVRGQGSAAPEFVGSVRLRVIPEPLDGSWWEWRVPAFESVKWKTGFALVGDFANRSRFASIALLNAELSEVRSEENPQINPCDYFPIQVQSRNGIAAGGRTAFSFGVLQDWGWISSGTYHIYGPLIKTFAYAVSFACTDEFGNVYSTQCSTQRVREIEISYTKRMAAVTALTSTISALVLAIAAAAALAGIITAPAAVALFAAAGISYGIAAAAGAIAKDPPAPDLQYCDPVDVVPLPLPRWPTVGSSDSLTALWSLLKAASHLLALENARTVSRARLLGARLAGDEAALEKQREGYLKIEREMIETADRLGKILPDVQKEVDNDPRLDPKNVEPWLNALTQSGFSEAMQRAMREAKLEVTEINSLAALLRYPDLVELVRVNGLSLVPFVVSLQRLVQAVQSEREMVLAGETYVHVSGRGKWLPEEAADDVEARLRPCRQRSC